jgi:AcrR family transcriptional regulator
MDPEAGLLKISELEKLSGIPGYTIHQYVRGGLLPKPIKTSRTMAYYNESHLERLRMIREIKGSSRVPVSFLKKLLAEGDEVSKPDDNGEQSVDTGKKKDAAATRKRQIRDAARKVFLEKGFQQTRIKDITSAAGISTGTFYIYYKDKQELFMDAIDETIQNTVAAIAGIASSKGDFQKRTATFAQYYMEHYEYFSGIVNQLRGMMAATEPSAREKFKILHNHLADTLVNEIRVAINKGLIRDVDPDLLAHSIMGMVEFLSIHIYFNDTHTTSQAISFMFDVLMNGIA